MAAVASEDRQLTRYGALAADVVLVLLVAVGTLAALGPSGWALPLLALSVAGVALRLFAGRRFWDEVLLGSSLVPRTLAITGCAVAMTRAAPDPERLVPDAAEVAGASLAAALLVGGAVAEFYLRRAAAFQSPVVAHLPGVGAGRRTADLSVPVVAASLAATLVGMLGVALGASSWWWLLAAVAALVPSAVLGVQGRAQILRGRRLRKLVPRAVANYAPDFVVYTSRPDDASYQVMMWLPYLQRSGQRFLIITRNAVPAEALALLTDVPVVEARRISDLDALVGPSLKAAFYVNASSGNGAFVRYQHLRHVYLGHGDSDKPPSYNPTHAMYDVIFAAGPAAARRYGAHGVRIPAEKFQIVGRPQVENIQPALAPIAEVAEPVVLYAPTWRGHVEETKLSSLAVGEGIVSALLQRGATVIFRPHPFSYDFPEDAAVVERIQRLLTDNARVTGRAHLWGAAAESERGILDCMNASDALVSDVSSVVSDYLFSGKPLTMVAVPSEPEAFVADYPVARAAYVVRGDLSNLDDSLAQMLGPDPLAPTRATIRVDYLGDFDTENYAAAFVDAVRDVVSKAADALEEGELDDTDGGEGPSAGPGYRALIVATGLKILGTVLALASLAAALLAAPALLTVVLAVAALTSAWRSLSAEVAQRSRWSELLDDSTATRAVLLVTLAVLTSGPGGVRAGVAVAVVLLAVGLVGEAHIRTAWGRLGLEAEGLPAVRAETAELVPRGVVPLASAGVILLSLVLSLLAAPGWLLALLSVGFFVVFLIVVVRASVRAGRVVAAEGRLRGALIELSPQFVVYFASTVGAAYQVGMWLPYLARVGRRFVVVTRTVPMMREIASVARAQGIEVPVIHRPTLSSVEEVVVPSMTAAFYVNNAVRNTHLVERRELTHVWLNHGDSEKPACFNPVHAIYDLLFAAGQAGVDRYARHGVVIPAEKFRIVGRPQVEAIETARGPVADQQPPTVLYAPTWQGPFADTRVYSLPMGRDIVEGLLARGARVIFRAHPFNYRFPACVAMITEIGRVLAADREVTGRQHLWGAAAEKQLSIEECFNASDAMVADVSAVVSDYLQSNKPFAIVSVGRSPEDLLRQAPAAAAGSVLRQDLTNLDEVLTDLLHSDPLATARQQIKVYYLGEFGAERYADGFLDAARDVIDSGRRRSTPTRG